LLGEVESDGMKLSELGRFVEKAILYITEHYENISVDSYTVMPNHIHFIIVIQRPGGYAKQNQDMVSIPSHDNDAAEPRLASIPDIIRNFKSYTATEFYKTHKYSLWLRGYFDNVIQSDEELDEKRRYISNNPAKWREDKFYLYPGKTEESLHVRP
jgi:putative transposase